MCTHTYTDTRAINYSELKKLFYKMYLTGETASNSGCIGTNKGMSIFLKINSSPVIINGAEIMRLEWKYCFVT